MQKDLHKFWKLKRRLRRAFGAWGFMLVVVLIVFAVRACNEQFQEPYNMDYRPMDTQQQKATRPGR